MITDIHAHYQAQRYLDTLARLSASPLSPMLSRFPSTDDADHLAARLAMMDEAAVKRQILSPVSGAPPYFEDESSAVEAARVCNDTYAEIQARYPGRLHGMISLPLPHIDASLRELERASDELGLIGVNIHCTVLDKSPVEAEYEPLYAELDRRKAVVFFHPTQNGICSPLINDYKFTTSAGASMEDTVIALHLIAKAIPARYPNVRFVIPHFGGLMPMQLERLDNQVPQFHPSLPEKPSETARRLYYDTVGHGSQAALMCSYMAFGPEHLVTGSDWPVLLSFESYGETFSYIERAEIPREAREQILNRSAAALYNFAD